MSASTLMLFLELSLIRWSGAQVVHLSYFSNFILLGSFLGIGLGFLRANRSKRGQPLYSIVALLAYVGFLSAFPVAVNRDQGSVIYFTSLSTSWTADLGHAACDLSRGSRDHGWPRRAGGHLLLPTAPIGRLPL
jgi:hypothetical protein